MKSSFFFVLSAISGLVKAVDVVTPGPGMPSLESVGLSNEKLYNMALEEATNPGTHLVSRAVSRVESPLLSKRFEPHCVPDASAEYFCALQCILYLENLGTTPVARETLGRRRAGNPARCDTTPKSKKLTQSEEEAIVGWFMMGIIFAVNAH
ncbi:hypothetical protein C8A00DRAFT_37381 [Chaetomidium leptoderma]|uniref:Uncharacterized protein n=1 Tax=Chaetomidium leptoderma TaxID=669021 RepID=A0AAN6ZTT9_9PEZI|nr:hypothetical protein C8A00DRAFT_37381 [Chaetomidium leptoderma]